jgi:Flp pilus assembly protein TadB
MPVAVVLILLASNPGYLSTLTSDKDGRIMLYGAIAGQIIAYFVINKIVNIKV